MAEKRVVKLVKVHFKRGLNKVKTENGVVIGTNFFDDSLCHEINLSGNTITFRPGVRPLGLNGNQMEMLFDDATARINFPVNPAEVVKMEMISARMEIEPFYLPALRVVRVSVPIKNLIQANGLFMELDVSGLRKKLGQMILPGQKGEQEDGAFKVMHFEILVCAGRAASIIQQALEAKLVPQKEHWTSVDSITAAEAAKIQTAG